jgi:hypothetical protein
MDIALDSPDLDLQKTLLEFAWRGRKYFYAPGVYLTGIIGGVCYSSGSWSVRWHADTVHAKPRIWGNYVKLTQ